MARYHGKSGLVYVSTTGTGNAASVGYLTDWALEMGASQDDATALNDDNKRYLQGTPDRKGTLNGFWLDDDDTLFDASESTDGCKVYLYPNKNAISKYFYGPAWMSISSVSTPVNGAVKVAAAFASNGNWGRH